MKCADSDNLLAIRLTGDLSPDDRGRLAGHLHECSACADKAEEYDSLADGLSSLRKAYGRLEVPFVFHPAQRADEENFASRRIFVLARAALATAAAIALGVVLWPDNVEPEAHTSVLSDATDRTAMVDMTRRDRVLRLPTIWPGMDQAHQRPEYVPVRVPRLPTLTQPPHRGASGIRCKTPTLVTQKRRIFRHDDSQSHHDHRNDVPVRDPARSQFG